MEIQPLKIGTKMAKVPVIQGGMGVGISLGNLAGAVAKEGGIGIISAAQPGFKEKDFEKNPLEANLRAVKSEYEKARKLAPDGIIGFNLMVAMEHYEEYVHAVVEAGADLIVSGAGLPTELPKYVGDSDILLAPIVSTAKSANVILKYWDKKYQRIPDLVVIEGPLAGGHLGFREDQLDEYEGQAIIGKCDVDSNDGLTGKFGVRNIPTVLFIKNGEVVDKQVGAAPKSTFEDKLKAIL